MFRFLILMLLSLFPMKYAFAYEFKQLDGVFLKLQNDYVEQVNARQLILDSSKAFEKFAPDIKLSYSDSQAFLYHHSALVKSFNLPKDNDVVSWKNYLTDVLKTATTYSFEANENASEIENAVVKTVIDHLDKYSRIEDTQDKKSFFEYTLKNNVLYVKLASFSEGDAEGLKRIVSLFPHINGLVFDLRGNQGGQFNEALKIADLFLDNTLITYSSERNHPKRFYTATKGDILSGKPLAILVDEYTASAAEMIAAAFNDQNRAILIGCKTYGKGTIQHAYSLSNQTLYLTSGYFFSPSGKKIDQQGIVPQVCTGIDEDCCFSDRTDPQKDILTAIRYIKHKLS